MQKRTVPGIKSVATVPFSRVLRAFKRGPIKMQRDHAKRALKAKHIGKKLSETQQVFQLVLLKGVERLVDGYTRLERIQLGLTEAPDNVVVIVYDEVRTIEAATAIYDQIDSPSSLKRAADRFDEGMRLTDLLGGLNSQLVLRGPKSAPQHAVGAANVRDGVVNCERGIRFVDRLGLDRTHESVGVLATYYSIGQYAASMPDEAEDFIRKVNRRVFSPKKGSVQDAHVVAFRKFLDIKRENGSTTGGKNVKDIHEHGLAAFLSFVGIDPRTSGFMAADVTQLTLANFQQALAVARKHK